MQNPAKVIVIDEKSQEQPKDKVQAQTALKSMPQQPVKKDDEPQPLREKSGFSDCGGLNFDTTAKRMMVSRPDSQKMQKAKAPQGHCAGSAPACHKENSKKADKRTSRARKSTTSANLEGPAADILLRGGASA
jgi:hypothetical protein